MDRTVSVRSPSNFISPSRSSTAANTPTVGAREENLFNDSLISSFEKLGMTGLNDTTAVITQDPAEEDRGISPENFEDATQDITSQDNVQQGVEKPQDSGKTNKTNLNTTHDIVPSGGETNETNLNKTHEVVPSEYEINETNLNTTHEVVPSGCETNLTVPNNVAPLVNKNLLPSKKVDLNDSLTSMFEKMCSIPSGPTDDAEVPAQVNQIKSPLVVPGNNVTKSPFTPANKLFKIDLSKVDDPSYDPLQPPVVNSPVLDVANTTIDNTVVPSPIPKKKEYDINFEKINDPNFDPFETKELCVNTPTLETEEEALEGMQFIEEQKYIEMTENEKQSQKSDTSSEVSNVAEGSQEQVTGTNDINVCIKPEEIVNEVSNATETERTICVESAEPSVVSKEQMSSPVKKNSTSDSSSINVGNITPLKKIATNVEPSPCKRTETSIINVQTPTRKYQHPVEECSENEVQISTPVRKAQPTPIKNYVDTPVKQELIVPEPELLEDEPLPLKKSYNLDFLDNLDDPNFDPFSTKTAVSNSPAKDKVKNTPVKPTPVKAEPTPVKAQPTPVKAQPTPVKAQPTPVKAQPTPVKAQSTPVKISTPAKAEPTAIKNYVDSPVKQELNETEPELLEDEPLPPKKSYNMGFLDNLDDPNFDPFSTKTAVSNSPTKDKVKNTPVKQPPVIAEPTPVKAELTPVKAEPTPVKAGPTPVKAEPTPVKAVPTPAKAVPTPAKAVPTPVKAVPTPTKAQPTPVKISTPAKADPMAIKNYVDAPVKQKLIEPETELLEDEPLPPKKSYNMDFLDNLDDPNFDPFSTKTAVSNSPTKDKMKNTPVKPHPVKAEPTPVKAVPTLAKAVPTPAKAVPTPVKAVPTPTKAQTTPVKISTPAKAETTAIRNHVDTPVKPELLEDEPLPPKKSYNMEFLDNLDDPNFDPFSTKTAVSNSPAKDKVKNTPVKPPPVKAEPTPVKAEPTPVKIAVTPVKAESTEVATPLSSDVNNTHDATQEKNIATTDEVSDSVEEEPVPPQKAYDLGFLDNLDDPKFDPFSTKASISNSPGKGGIKNTPVKNSVIEKSEPTPVKKSEPTPVKKSEPTPVKKSEPTPGQEVGAHAGQEVGAHAGQEVGAHAGQEVGAHAGQEVGAHAGQEVGAHAGQEVRAHPSKIH
ncbi:unnamed protein product [Meganyctiphanes norvegica]|uniref:Uncharacterized protein n=1 Tax=Meganyctiphanes norvegica TaxID=48144 RepID=A0AAV2SK63_MEGNR